MRVMFVLIICLLIAPALCGRVCAEVISKKVMRVSDQYAFVNEAGNLFGKGFFVDFTDGFRVFLYTYDADRYSVVPKKAMSGMSEHSLLEGPKDYNPQSLSNMQRKFKSLEKGQGQLEITDEHVETIAVYSLNSPEFAHRWHSEEDNRVLFRRALESGETFTGPVVSFDEVKITMPRRIIRSRDIAEVGEIGMTTGGSVFIAPVDLKSGETVYFNIVTKDPNNRQELQNFLNEIKSRLSGQPFLLDVQVIHHQDAIYVIDHNGQPQTWSGWILWIRDYEYQDDSGRLDGDAENLDLPASNGILFKS